MEKLTKEESTESKEPNYIYSEDDDRELIGVD